MQPQNRTPEDVMVRQQLPRKTGLLMIRIGTMHQVKAPKKATRSAKGIPGASLEVKELGQYPEVKTTALCLSCGKTYKNEKELVADHPTAADMRLNKETHVWGFWSDDKEDTTDPNSPAIGLLSTKPLLDEIAA